MKTWFRSILCFSFFVQLEKIPLRLYLVHTLLMVVIYKENIP